MKGTKYIVRKRALGDVLWIEPVIAALAQRYKRVVVYTKYNTLFENYPLKNVVFKNKLSFLEKVYLRLERISKAYILSIDLEGAYENNPNIHFLNAYQKKAKLPMTKEYPKIYLSQKEKQHRLIKGKYIVLHLESYADNPLRQVYGVDWNEVVRYLIERDYKVVQIGLNPQFLIGTIVPKTSLRELISLIHHSDYFIGLDSGPSHIASSLRVPALILFGAINPSLRHFLDLFNGILIKQPCEYDSGNPISDLNGLTCNFANSDGQPKCCIYTTRYIISKVAQLIDLHATEFN